MGNDSPTFNPWNMLCIYCRPSSCIPPPRSKQLFPPINRPLLLVSLLCMGTKQVGLYTTQGIVPLRAFCSSSAHFSVPLGSEEWERVREWHSSEWQPFLAGYSVLYLVGRGNWDAGLGDRGESSGLVSSGLEQQETPCLSDMGERKKAEELWQSLLTQGNCKFIRLEMQLILIWDSDKLMSMERVTTTSDVGESHSQKRTHNGTMLSAWIS